jgi:hypothetical protein
MQSLFLDGHISVPDNTFTPIGEAARKPLSPDYAAEIQKNCTKALQVPDIIAKPGIWRRNWDKPSW